MCVRAPSQGVGAGALIVETSCHRSSLDGDCDGRLSDPSSITVPIMFLAGHLGGIASISVAGAIIDP